MTLKNKPIYRMSEAGRAKRGSDKWRESIRIGVIHFYNSLLPQDKALLIEKQNRGKRGSKKPESWKKQMSDRVSNKDNPMYGKPHTKETRVKMSIGQKLAYQTGKHQLLSKDKLDRILSLAAKARIAKGTYAVISQSLKNHFKTHINPFKGKHHTKETKELLSNLIKNKIINRIPPFDKVGFQNMTRKQLQEINRRTIAKCCAHPNGFESKVMSLIDSACPSQYRFAGDASFRIANLYPDFVNINGKKKLIEAFGDYYHKGENPQNKIDKYAEFGFDCLVIWEKDLAERTDKELINLIKKFNRRKRWIEKRYIV